MSSARRKTNRLLAIDFSSRGFGFVVFERPQLLIDWGVARLKAHESEAALRRIEGLLQRYDPYQLVLEDVARNPRRSRRLCVFVRLIRSLYQDRGVRVRLIRPAHVRKFFAVSMAATKHQIATAIAEALPELAPRLPLKRKPWTSEAESMAIFDAAAMIFAALKEMPRRPGSGQDEGVGSTPLQHP